MAKNDLKVRAVVIIDGKEVPWESLSYEERLRRQKKMSESASEYLTRYYADKPEQFAQLKKAFES